ncbi:MAG TPA: glycosyltransferase family 39 protein [Streptosporangiaceae bacterium]
MGGPRPDTAGLAASTGSPASLAPGQRNDTGAAARRVPGWLVVVVPVLAELAAGGYRIAGPSLWRDEAATISGSQRPVAAIWAMLPSQDAVHVPYYLLMHLVIAVAGTSATALRVPSLIAMCLAAGLTAALGRRLAELSRLPFAPLAGLLAGLLLVVSPLTTRYAQEARPYALASLFAVLASYLLVRAVAGSQRWWWALYSASLVLAGLVNLFALLLLVAHGISLLIARQPAGRDAAAGDPGTSGKAGGTAGGMAGTAVLRRWLAAAVAAAVVLAPLAFLTAGQSSQLSWVTRPTPSTVASLVRDFAGSAALIVVVAALALLGSAAGTGIRRGDGLTLAWIALPWLVVPPVILLAVSLAKPLYVERYVLFCLPALAILTSAGLIWLAVLVRRALAGKGLGRRLAGALALAPSVVAALVIVLALAGPQRAVRQVTARPDDLRAVAAVLAGHERPGDAILYSPWDTEIIGVAYPAPFRRLRDIGLGQSPIASHTLRGLPAGPAVVAARLRGVTRLWTVQWQHPLTPGVSQPAWLTRFLAGMREVGHWDVRSVVLRLYTVR